MQEWASSAFATIDYKPAGGRVQLDPTRVYVFRPEPIAVVERKFWDRVPQQIQGLDLTGIDIGNDTVKLIASRFKNLIYLSLADTSVDDGIFEMLATLPHLELLEVRDTEIKGKGFVHLSNFQSLKHLGLQSCEIAAENFKFLPSAKKVIDLRLARTSLRDEGCKFVSQMPSLITLGLASTDVTDKGIAHLIPLKDRLQWLDISHGPTTDEALKTIGQFRSLTNLTLRTRKPKRFTGKGIEYLRNARSLAHVDIGASVIEDDVVAALGKSTPKLRQLFLNGSPSLTDAGFKHLGTMRDMQGFFAAETDGGNAILEVSMKMPKLESLQVGSTRIDDKALVRFCDAGKQLIHLSADNTQVSDAGVVALHKLPNLQTLVLNATKVSDAGIKHLVKIKRLKGIGLMHTNVTKAGVAELKKALPNCHVSY